MIIIIYFYNIYKITYVIVFLEPTNSTDFIYHSMLRSFLFNSDYIHRNSYTGLFSYVKSMEKTIREKFLQSPFWDNDPKYPRVVPWDQNFLVKIILILFYTDDTLCILLNYWAKSHEIAEKQTFPYRIDNLYDFSSFFWFFMTFRPITQKNSYNIISIE